MFNNGNNGGGNPNHDEKGRFTSGSNRSSGLTIEQKLDKLGFGPGEDLIKEDFQKPHQYIGGRNPNITTNRQIQYIFDKARKKFGLGTGKKNPSKLTLDDFNLVNSSRKFAIDRDLDNLQGLYQRMLDEGLDSQATKDYNEAYEKFWERWGNSWKGTNNDDRQEKVSQESPWNPNKPNNPYSPINQLKPFTKDMFVLKK